MTDQIDPAAARPPAADGALSPDMLRVGDRDILIGDRLAIGRRDPEPGAAPTVWDGELAQITAGAGALWLPSGRVSAAHAEIRADATGTWIVDLGSRNGTLVNQERLAPERPRRLSSGDVVRVGPFELRALAGRQTTGPESAPAGVVAAWQEPVAVGAQLRIGRDPANDLQLDDPNVSRFHAEITRVGDRVLLRDLGSRNGTLVDGEPARRAVLSPGSRLEIGAYRLTFTGQLIAAQDERAALRLDVNGVAMAVGAKQLLQPTSFTVEPGELVAIIGESGAGKSTLLKAIAGVTAPTAGQVLLNGIPVARRLTAVGYVPQSDIVHGLLTVREALSYAARLRLPTDTEAQEIDHAVDRVLDQLELRPHAETPVDRLSGGQRKRAGVAVELLGRPGILLLDEPATGLDPGLEKKLMEFLRTLSDQSRPVITITHSTKQMNLCDKLIVMGRGGVLCFAGVPAQALEFFEVDDFDDIYTALAEHDEGHWALRQQALDGPAAVSAAVAAGPAPAPDAPPVVPQAMILARRYLKLVLRDRRNLAILLGQAPILALLIAIGFSRRVFNPGGALIEAPTLLFVTVITTMWLGAIASAREIVKERSVFVRERAVGVSNRAYLLSKAIVLFALTSVQTLILVVILLGLRHLYAGTGTYLKVVALLLLTGLASVGLGLLASTLARSEDQATSFIPGLLIPQLLFGGSIIPLAGKGIVIKVLATIMLARWAFAGLGRAISLGQSAPVVEHYGSLFSTSLALLLLAVVAFSVIFFGAVLLRLARLSA